MRKFEYQPATDLHLPPGRRSTSVLRDPGLIGMATHRAGRTMMRGYLRLAHRLSVEGCNHLPAEPPCVVVANHASHLDAPALTAALPKAWCRRIFPLAAGDVFFETPTAAHASAALINALPVDRKHGARHAIAALRGRLEVQRCVFLLFPEGTRSADGRLADFKPGLGMLVAGMAVPVVPAWIDGAYRSWPRQRRWPRPGPVRVRFGSALSFADARNRRNGWERVADEARAAVSALAPDAPGAEAAVESGARCR